LTHAWSRALFLALVLLVSGILTFLSAKVYLAARWNASSNPERWLKAARLEPGNAAYWERMGLSRVWDLSAAGAGEAVSYFQKATEIDPLSAELWMELADAYEMSGDPVRAQDAFEKAQRSYPISAEVAWRYGSFLLYQAKLPEGYEQLRRAISIDPSRTQEAIAACWQANEDLTPILNKVLPPKSSYYQEAIDFFLSRNRLESALAVWNRQQQLGLPTELAHTTPLVDALLEQDRVTEAQHTWQKTLKLTSWAPDSAGARSLVFNGGFETCVANGGFDWREVPVSAAKFEFDETEAHSGSRSLRIAFDGTTNLDFEHLFQYVVIDPATHYHFSAYLRTEGISTDRGMRFDILDPRAPSQTRVATQELRGTNPWTRVEADLITGPSTHLLKITLQRLPSWKFDNKLRGTVWVDDVSLSPVATHVEGRSD
jgi:tetratricopeptide (TPR) repeat protein